MPFHNIIANYGILHIFNAYLWTSWMMGLSINEANYDNLFTQIKPCVVYIILVMYNRSQQHLQQISFLSQAVSQVIQAGWLLCDICMFSVITAW